MFVQFEGTPWLPCLDYIMNLTLPCILIPIIHSVGRCHAMTVYPCEIQVIIIVCRQPMDLNSTPFVCDSILRDSLSKVLRPSSSGKG